MMQMPSLYYLRLPERLIEDPNDFYSSGIQEATKIRNLCTTCQRLFSTTTKNMELYLLGDRDIYRIDVYNTGIPKMLVAQVYYLPKEMRLDLFDGENPRVPLYMWKSKKCVFKNVPIVLDTIKAETMLVSLISNH